MAEDDTIKRQNYALAMVDATTRIMKARDDLFDLANRILQEGVTFQEADFADHVKLRHIMPADLVAVMASADALNSWLTTTNHEDNLYKIILNP